MENSYCILITTAGTKENADKITNTLLQKRLVSCVQETKSVSSYYWNGKIEKNEEFVLTMKTKKSLYEEAEKAILEVHDYEVPEILMYEIVEGHKDYLDWIDKETK